MKHLFLIAGLIPFTAFAGGTEIAGGVPGRVLAECFAKLRGGTEITARVQPIRGEGLTLRVIADGETTIWDRVTKDENDSRGIIYAGNNASLLIPNIQPRNRPGTYRALLSIGDDKAIALNCQ